VRWADNLLDRTGSPEEFAETLRWGMGRLKSLRDGGEAQNPREQGLLRFFQTADPELVELFLRSTAAAEFEKSQLDGPPSQAELDKIIRYNAVIPVLLHCRLFLEGLGLDAERVREFGESFGQVTRYADVFVDLDEDLANGIVPISREACDRIGMDPDRAGEAGNRVAIRRELRGDYQVHRRRAQTALDAMGADRLIRFAYGIVMQAFDRCVYGNVAAMPSFGAFLLRYADQAVPLLGFVASSVTVSMRERRKVDASR
jgi:phytoene/squalene synthetase